MRGIFLVSIAVLAAAIAKAQTAGGEKSDAEQGKGLAPPPTQWESRVTDAFFPDARAALVGPRPASLTAAVTSGAKTNQQQQSTVGRPSDSNLNGASVRESLPWSKIISADSLQDEIKSLAPLLADDVKTQQAFLGGAYKKSRRTLSLLAALFAITGEYDGDARWKNQAAAARDLFARSGYNCKASTDQTFRDAKQRSDDLAALVRGESLEFPKAEPTNDWGKVADLLPLMSRLETAQRDRIAPWISADANFKKNEAPLTHEAEIVAALAEVISRPGMANADDEKFRAYAKALQKSAIELRQAIDDNDYNAARTAAGAINKACANCHNDFR